MTFGAKVFGDRSMEAVKVASDLIISAWRLVVMSGWLCGRALWPRIGHESIGVVMPQRHITCADAWAAAAVILLVYLLASPSLSS